MHTRLQSGFSLVELMIVVAIIGIMGLIATPNIVTGLPKYRVKAAARDLTSHLRKARAIAVRQQRPMSIQFDTDAKIYTIDGQSYPTEGTSLSEKYGSGVRFGSGAATASARSEEGLPDSGVTFSGSPPQFAFTSRGMADETSAGGAVYLTNNRLDAWCVQVSAAGNVSLSRWTGGAWE